MGNEETKMIGWLISTLESVDVIFVVGKKKEMRGEGKLTYESLCTLVHIGISNQTINRKARQQRCQLFVQV